MYVWKKSSWMTLLYMWYIRRMRYTQMLSALLNLWKKPGGISPVHSTGCATTTMVLQSSLKRKTSDRAADSATLSC